MHSDGCRRLGGSERTRDRAAPTQASQQQQQHYFIFLALASWLAGRQGQSVPRPSYYYSSSSSFHACAPAVWGFQRQKKKTLFSSLSTRP